MNDDLLARWAADLTAELDIEQSLDVEAVLRLAADAAHGIVRPAAPLTTFLVGVAIGQAGGDPARIAEILATVDATIARQSS